MIGGGGEEGGGRVETIWPLHELKNLQFHNEHDIHMSSNNYGTNGYVHYLNLLIIISHDCMFHILWEREKKLSIQGTSTLETWLRCRMALGGSCQVKTLFECQQKTKTLLFVFLPNGDDTKSLEEVGNSKSEKWKFGQIRNTPTSVYYYKFVSDDQFHTQKRR
jgi:hypothetical protein